jgi:hypothetical protein
MIAVTRRRVPTTSTKRRLVGSKAAEQYYACYMNLLPFLVDWLQVQQEQGVVTIQRHCDLCPLARELKLKLMGKDKHEEAKWM